MSEITDRARRSALGESFVPARGRLVQESDARVAEREYLGHRAAVMAMLRADFPRLRDHDELYQEAWAELLELRRRGEEVRNVRALLKKIAWRRAADSVRKHRPELIDPSSPAMALATDDELSPEDQVQLRLDADALRLVIDSLDERQAAALKLRFDLHLSAKEIQGCLGVSPKRLEKIVTEAYKQVLEQVSGPDGHESAWARRQRSLLLACEVGIASPRQRRRAQEMVARDARCRAMLRQMRESLHDIAVALPMPIIAEQDHIARRWEALIGRLYDLLTPGHGSASRIAERASGTPAAAEATAAGGAAVMGVGASAKLLVACIAAGGTVALCVGAAPVFHHRPAAPKPAPANGGRAAQPGRMNVRLPSRTTPPAPRRSVRASSSPARAEKPVSSRSSHPPPSPAPRGSTEFGPGALGSTPQQVAPARAPANGGGEFSP